MTEHAVVPETCTTDEPTSPRRMNKRKMKASASWNKLNKKTRSVDPLNHSPGEQITVGQASSADTTKSVNLSIKPKANRYILFFGYPNVFALD